MHRPLTILALVLVASSLSAHSSQRTVEISGYTFQVRRSDGLEGPGPNRFLDNRRTVWQDESGVHLRLWQRLGVWFSAEIVLDRPLGYGTYVFETVGDVASMDPPVILGLFTYDDRDPNDRREIDVEFGRFGDPTAPGAQFVVQPFDVDGRRYQFSVDPEGTRLTHVFEWTGDAVRFMVAHGHQARAVLDGGLDSIPAGLIAADWTFRQLPPDPGYATVHVNLWLYQSGRPRSEHEIVLASFHHTTKTPMQ